MFARIIPWLVVVFAFAGTSAEAKPASGGTSIDEPAALVLLAVGVAGLIIGRHVAKRRD